MDQSDLDREPKQKKMKLDQYTLDWSNVHSDWKPIFEENKDHLQKLESEIRKDYDKYNGYFQMFPPQKLVFNLFENLAYKDVKVVILGQDPYINPNQAMGFSFSVPKGEDIPPSLYNIYKELESDSDVDFTKPDHGDLTGWVKQGVFLLNNTLTVRQGKSNSHAAFKITDDNGKSSYLRWSDFTNHIIKKLSDENENLVFILWGSKQKEKAESKTVRGKIQPALIDSKKHLVLESVHPSPLSASRGFFGCKHFSKANEYLEQNGKAPINWQL